MGNHQIYSIKICIHSKIINLDSIYYANQMLLQICDNPGRISLLIRGLLLYDQWCMPFITMHE
jgi:hypothetical protein